MGDSLWLYRRNERNVTEHPGFILSDTAFSSVVSQATALPIASFGEHGGYSLLTAADVHNVRFREKPGQLFT
ncbi:MAG: hypothetical protein WBQ68_00385 [Terriglobales bacterium]